MNLRLLLTEECNRTCKGCCNNGFELQALPVCESFTGFDMIIITGGEPLLKFSELCEIVRRIRLETSAPIIIYTAYREDPDLLMKALELVDGITLTLHTRKDTEPFVKFNELIAKSPLTQKSLRLNVFNGVSTGGADLSNWQVKRNIRWIKDCPLPTDEVFMRAPVG